MGFSWSLNGERRHLTHAQKTIVALELLPELEAEARKRLEAAQFQGKDIHGVPIHSASAPIPSPKLADHRQSKAVDAAAAIVGVCRLNPGGQRFVRNP